MTERTLSCYAPLLTLSLAVVTAAFMAQGLQPEVADAL